MAESNITLNPGAAGSDVATMTDGSGYHHQKVVIGFDGGTSPTPVDSSNPLPISDAGGSLTVDGTVAVTNADITTIAGAVSGSEMQVDVLTMPSVAVTNAGITTIAGAVSGTEMQVDVLTMPTVTVTGTGGTFPVTDSGGSLTVDGTVAATQSGTWAVTGAAAEDAAASGNPVLIGGRYDSSARTLETGDAGALALNASGQLLVEIAAGAGSGGTAAADDADFTAGTTSGTPVMGAYQSTPTAVTDGDMGIIGITADREVKVSVTSGGVAGVVEDAAAAGGEEGIMVLAVRRDSASSGVSADGDFAALSVTSDGSLRVSGSSGTTQYAEDAAHTTGDQLVAMGAVRRDTAAAGSGTDGDYSTLNVDSTGRLWCNVSNTVTVGSHAVTNAGTFAVQAAQSGTWAVDLGATDNAVLDSIAASLALIDNAIATGNELQVDVVAALPAGTNNIGDVDILSIAAGDNNIGNVDVVTLPNVTLAAGTNTNEVVGDAADDAAAAGNPLSVGGYSIQTDGTDPGVVSAEGDAARLRTDMQRILLVNETHPRLFRASADYASAQTNATVQAAPGASLSLYITDVIISNGATAGNITLLDGSGGTVLLEIYPAINGGMTHSFRNPLRLTANTLLAITSTTVTTHSVTVTGYIAP